MYNISLTSVIPAKVSRPSSGGIKTLKLSVIILLLLSFAPVILPAQPKQKVTFGICSDVHINLMHDAEERLTTFVDDMNERKPDFVIELGDFVTPAEKYNPFWEIWNSLTCDSWHVIGNHEPDGGFSAEQVLKPRGMTRSYYVFEKNGFRFIVLDGNDKKSPDAKPYYNFIGPEQVTWLKKQLKETASPVIIFSHQALFSPKGEEKMGVENLQEIQQILNDHNAQNPKKPVIACFNGHTHFDYAENIRGIWYITINSMSYNWLGGDYAHIRYSEAVDKEFPYIKYTAPYKDPLYALVEISTRGTIRIKGKKSEWVGPSPWDLGYPEKLSKYINPVISDRLLKF